MSRRSLASAQLDFERRFAAGNLISASAKIKIIKWEIKIIQDYSRRAYPQQNAPNNQDFFKLNLKNLGASLLPHPVAKSSLKKTWGASLLPHPVAKSRGYMAKRIKIVWQGGKNLDFEFATLLLAVKRKSSWPARQASKPPARAARAGVWQGVKLPTWFILISWRKFDSPSNSHLE